MQGAKQTELQKESAVLGKAVKGSGDRESYLPAQVSTNKNGQLIATPLKWGGSSDFVAFERATALIIVPSGAREVEAETHVRIVYLPQ